MSTTAFKSVLLFILIVFVGACGGKSNGPSVIDLGISQHVQGIQQEPNGPVYSGPSWADEVAPIYKSLRGVSVIQLDDGGFPVYLAESSLQVSETALENGDLELSIVDSLGVPRPVFFRVRFAGSGMLPAELHRGDWGKPEAIVNTLETPIGDLDIGIVMIDEKDYTAAGCLGRTVFRLVMSSDAGRISSYVPQDRTGDVPATDPWKLNHLPYVNQKGTGYHAQWEDHNNHVDAYAENSESSGYRPWHRDKLDIAWDYARNYSDPEDSETYIDELMPPLNIDPDTQQQVEYETGRRLQFYQVFHGDYDLNGEVNVADITPVGRLCSATNYYSDYDAEYGASHGIEIDSGSNPVVYSYTPFRPDDHGLSKPGFDDNYNLVDGSRDGRVYHPYGTENEDQEARNWIDDPPSDPDEQYESDLFAIATHKYESFANYRIEVWKTEGSKEDHDTSFPAEYDDELRAEIMAFDGDYQTYLDTSPTWPFLIEKDIYYKSLLRGQEDSGDFWIRIVPLDHHGPYNTSKIAVTIIPEAFSISPHYPEPPQQDFTPPTWADNGHGLVTANPSGVVFRGVYVEWDQAMEEDQDSGVHGYRIYVRIDGSGEADWTARQVVDYVRDQVDYDMDDCVHTSLATDCFVLELNFPGLTRYTISGVQVDGTTPWVIPMLDITQYNNWTPGKRVAVVVTAVTRNGEETYRTFREHGQGLTNPPEDYEDIWDDELDDLNVGYTFVSYDPTPPAWEQYPTEYDEDVFVTDVLDSEFSISPDGDEGYNVYWGFASDPETGVRDYIAYYTFDSNDVELNETTGEYEFDPEALDDLETAGQTVSATDLQDAGDDFSMLQFSKRFMFCEIPSGYDRSDTGYVMVRAINGEETPTSNLVATVLKLTDDSTIFKRVVLEDDDSNPSGPSPDFTSGEMVWRGETDGETEGLALVYGADASTFDSDENNHLFAPNIGAYYYAGEPGEHPLDVNDWNKFLEPGEFWIDEAIHPGDLEEDVTQKVEEECELAVSFDSPSDNPRVAFHALGEYDEAESPELGGHVYTFKADETDTNDIWYIEHLEYPYLPADTQELRQYPLDLASDIMCLAYDWPEETAVYEANIYTPTVMDAGLASPFYSGSVHDMWQLRDYGTSVQGSLLESMTLDDYRYNLGWTIFGPAYNEDLEIVGGSDLQISPLELFWHKFTPDLREDLFPSPDYSNRLKPSREGSDFSWETPDLCLHATMTSGSQIGVPATLSVHEYDSSNWGYVLYNSSTTAGYGGMGIARAEEPTGTPSVDRFTGGISGYPVLLNTISDQGDYDAHYDVIDSLFGGSAFNFRGNRVTVFNDDGGAFYDTEQLETDPENLDDMLVESPLSFAFIQYDATENEHIELYYGEIYNINTEDIDDAVCVIELVDSLDVSDPANQGTEEFRLLWCSLGMATVAIGQEVRIVPVIAYVVETDDATELKIASLKSDFFHTPDSDDFFDFYWQYGASPAGGFVYSGQEGDEDTPVDLEGSPVTSS